MRFSDSTRSSIILEICCLDSFDANLIVFPAAHSDFEENAGKLWRSGQMSEACSE